jgi:hypothetical protein
MIARCRGKYSTNTHAVIMEKQQLVTDESVEFEKKLVEGEDCRKITNNLRGIYNYTPT